MPAPPPSFFNRPLLGKPRPQPERETDPARVELALLRRDRDARNTADFMTALLGGQVLLSLAMGSLVFASLPASLTQTQEGVLSIAVMPLYILGPFIIAATLFLVGVPRGVRFLSGRDLLPVYRRTERPPWSRRTVKRLRIAVAAAALLGPLGLAAVIAESPRDLALKWAMFLGGLLVWGSPILLSLELMRRGETVLCRSCGYPRETPTPDCCPECGNPWLDRWRSRMGCRHPKPWLLCLFIGLLGIGLAMFSGSMSLQH